MNLKTLFVSVLLGSMTAAMPSYDARRSYHEVEGFGELGDRQLYLPEVDRLA